MRKFLRGERRVKPHDLDVFLIALLLAGIIVLGVFFGSQFSHLCHGQRDIANVSAEQFKHSSARSKKLLTHANIPGISHEELVRTTKLSQQEEHKRIDTLEAAADKACQVLP